MKKYLPLFTILLSTLTRAQVPEDALRYSFYPQNGTARNLAIGGAMGSLGGDINAAYVNPAGLGFYKTNEFVLTPGFNLNKNKASYRDNASRNNTNSLGFGASGVVMGFSPRYKPSVNMAFSFTITQTANFNNRIHYSGLNNYSSFSEQFAEEFAKSGYSIDDALSYNSPLPYTAGPALYTYLIDTVKVNGTYQIKAAPEYILDAGQALFQEMDKTTTGGISEPALGFAWSRNNKLYLGASLGVPLVNYTSNTVFSERDTSSNANNHFSSFSYTDNFTTKGVGINLKLGIIYRPVDYIRLGLAIHTPTYYSLTDTRQTTLATQLENPLGGFSVSSNTFTNDVPGQANYGQLTPFKALLSASYVFREVEDVKKQRAFLTADVEYVHYKGSRFNTEEKTPTTVNKTYYSSLNQVVATDYKGNLNFRLGGELKFNVIMARLGFAYYSNPYTDAAFKASRLLLSGGLGYRNKGVFVDLTYVYSSNKDVSFPYRLSDRANTYATLNRTGGNIVATVGFKF